MSVHRAAIGPGFTELRQNTPRTWPYQNRRSTLHPPVERTDNRTLLTPPNSESAIAPNQRYWTPRPAPVPGTGFVPDLCTLGGNGDLAHRQGAAIHLHTADTSRTNRVLT